MRVETSTTMVKSTECLLSKTMFGFTSYSIIAFKKLDSRKLIGRLVDASRKTTLKGTRKPYQYSSYGTMAGTMKAVVIQEQHKAKVADAPIPKIRPDYVKVKTIAVALNPSTGSFPTVSGKYIDLSQPIGSILPA